MDTKTIINILADDIKRKFKLFEPSVIIQYYKNDTKNFPESIREFFLRNIHCSIVDTNIKMAMKLVFNKMPFDKNYVLLNYQKEYLNIKFLFYPSNSNFKKLIILFSGFSNHHTYNRYSWFFDDTERWSSEYCYLFLNDPSNHWYVGTPDNPTIAKYMHIINTIISNNNIERKNVVTIGASMGGYGALYYGLSLNLGLVISINSLLVRCASSCHDNSIWSKKIFECAYNFIDIDTLFFKYSKNYNHKPYIYIESSDYPADKYKLDTIMQLLINNRYEFTLRKFNVPVHSTDHPTLTQINDILNFYFGLIKK